MKLRICSDLHTEFGPFKIEPAGEDLLILAGDIGIHTRAMPFMKMTAMDLDVPIIVIAGNHEFYRVEDLDQHTWESTLDDLRSAADHDAVVVKGQVTFLEDAAVVYEGVRFIAATLFTDMKLFGENPLIRYSVQRGMADYRVVYSRETHHKLMVDQVIERHAASIGFIKKTLEEPHDGPTVVVTHHAPSYLSVPDRFKHDTVSAGYASRLEEMIMDLKPTLWLHGHTHNSFDYSIGDTRIVCNPRGYVQHELNDEFDPLKIIEV